MKRSMENIDVQICSNTLDLVASVSSLVSVLMLSQTRLFCISMYKI